MKQLLSEAGGVKTYIDISPLTNPQHAGWTRVKIYTLAEWSRHPESEQVKIDLCLDPGDFANLKTVLNSL